MGQISAKIPQADALRLCLYTRNQILINVKFGVENIIHTHITTGAFIFDKSKVEKCKQDRIDNQIGDTPKLYQLNVLVSAQK